MSAREEILDRLRTPGGHPAQLPEVRHPGRSLPDAVDLFVARAHEAGVTVMRGSSRECTAALADDLRRRGVRLVVAWDDPLLADFRSAVAAAGIEVLLPPQATAVRLAASDAGITAADYAIAETGTLVLACSPARPRATSLLPPLHVAVLPEDRVLPTLGHLFGLLRALPSALTLVTGPSRTADIELTPVQGVHGPTSVHVYLIPPVPHP